jgi:thymidylate synthase
MLEFQKNNIKGNKMEEYEILRDLINFNTAFDVQNKSIMEYLDEFFRELGFLNHYVNNLHIYDRHIDIMKEVLNNPEFPAPELWINPEVKNLEDFTVDDFKLINYQSTKYQGKIPVAV